MKERATDTRGNRLVINGDSVTYRGQRFKLGKVPQQRTVIPADGSPNRIKAERLRLAELED